MGRLQLGVGLCAHTAEKFSERKKTARQPKTRLRVRPGCGRETARDRRAHWRPT